MRFGVSAAAVVLNDRRVLLVHHQEPRRYDFWLPPSGSLKGEESIFDCAEREALEETGLYVELDRIVYVQEFVEPDYHFCKFFILCKTYSGELTLANKDADESFLVDARFCAQAELQRLNVRPEILKHQFWDDLEAGFPQIRYLGLVRLEA